jgi:predicted nucleotidyltransferase
MTASDDEARQAALDFTRRIAGSWRARSGPRLLGTYLIGSLAHGGFNRRYSDIDMAVVADTPLDDAQLDDMRAQGRAIAPDLAAKLSIFWADRDFSTGRFPPLDRVDYLDHAVALMEDERVTPERPSIDEIRAYLRGAPFESWATGARQFAALDTLEPENHKPYLRALLYPARFVYSWTTGRMASNDEAVAFVGEQRPPGLDVELVTRAFDCRSDARDPDGLFPERGALPSQVEACRRLISAQ